MDWRIKSAIQRAVARLPSSFGYDLYYWMQRNFGGLRRLDPHEWIQAALEICRHIQAQGRNPRGKTFCEIGTGRRLGIPITLWLLGAEKTVTVDIHPLLKGELVRQDLEFVVNNKECVRSLFQNSPLCEDRLEQLIEFTTDRYSLEGLLGLCGIRYMAPADAANLSVPSGAIDFHVSHKVFEHIPQEDLKGIITEGNRVVRSDGIFIHRIDFKDHFSYSDRRISPINFLRFDDAQWDRIAGNRYLYLNRLRCDDFVRLYTNCGHRILTTEIERSDSIEALLAGQSLVLHGRFASKPSDVLAITGAWVVSEHCPQVAK